MAVMRLEWVALSVIIVETALWEFSISFLHG